MIYIFLGGVGLQESIFCESKIKVLKTHSLIGSSGKGFKLEVHLAQINLDRIAFNLIRQAKQARQAIYILLNLFGIHALAS